MLGVRGGVERCPQVESYTVPAYSGWSRPQTHAKSCQTRELEVVRCHYLGEALLRFRRRVAYHATMCSNASEIEGASP